MIVTFEDSNGDEVTITKEFEGTIQGEFVQDASGGNMGGELPILDAAKTPILPTWAFVILQIVILVIIIPVTRKVKLGLYRRKLRKQEEAE